MLTSLLWRRGWRNLPGRAGPRLVSISPAANTTGASISATMVLIYDRPIFGASDFYAALYNAASDPDPLEEWNEDLADEGTEPGDYQFSGNTLTLYPSANLPAGDAFARYVQGVVDAAGRSAQNVFDEFATGAAPLIQGPSGVAGATASTASLDENNANPTVVAIFTSSVPATFSTNGGADGASFSFSAIDASTASLSLNAVANYEVKDTYVVVVRATATSGGATSDQTFTLGILNVDEGEPVLDITSFNDTTKALDFDVSEAATIYWATHPDGSPPTRAQIVAGTGGGIYEAGSFTAVDGVPEVLPLDDAVTLPGTRGLSLVAEDADTLLSDVETISFTMLADDSTSPTISSSSPADNATGVALTVSPTITFDEAIAFGTGNIVLRENNGGWSDLETFDVATEQGTGNGQVSISGSTLTINPTSDLTASREYAIRIASTAIEDIFGNAFAGIANDTTLSFTATAAGISFVALGSGVSSNSGDPANVPLATHSTGDRLLIAGMHSHSQTVTTPSGYSVAVDPTGWTTGVPNAVLFHKADGGSETDPVVLDFSAASKHAGIAATYRGVSGTGASSSTAVFNNTACNLTGITATAGRTLVLVIAVGGTNSEAQITVPSGFTKRGSIATPDSTWRLLIADYINHPGGATGTLALSATNAATWSVGVVELAP